MVIIRGLTRLSDQGVVAMLGILLKQETVSGSGISWAIIEAYILQCTL